MVGMLLTGVFAAEVGLVYGETTTFFNHLLALIGVTIFAFVGSYVLLLVTNLIVPIRVNATEEAEGLDISQHGEKIV